MLTFPIICGPSEGSGTARFQRVSSRFLCDVLVLSDPGLSHASVSSLFLCREKERDVWASCLLLGVSSDGFNHSWVPSSFTFLTPSPPVYPSYSLLQPECTPVITSDIAPLWHPAPVALGVCPGAQSSSSWWCFQSWPPALFLACCLSGLNHLFSVRLRLECIFTLLVCKSFLHVCDRRSLKDVFFSSPTFTRNSSSYDYMSQVKWKTENTNVRNNKREKLFKFIYCH